MAFSDYSAPKVDGYAAGRMLSQRFAQNIVQSQIWKNGSGVTEEYGNTGENVEIRVLRQKGLVSSFRTLGQGTVNNGHFNTANPEEPASQEYGIKVNNVFDQSIDIATVLDDMIALNVLNQTGINLEQRITLLINAFSLALAVSGAYNYAINESDQTRIISFDPATEDLFAKYMSAHELLDRGDQDNGISTFPLEQRIGVFSTTGKYELLNSAKSLFDINSSRGVRLAEIGLAGASSELALEEGARLNTQVDGYFGDLNSTPLHMMTPSIVSEAELILDMTPGKLTDGLYGVVNASQAIARVFAVPDRQKIIDSPQSHGLRIQPLVRWGGTVFFPKGIALITTEAFATALSTETETVDVVGPDSR